MGGFSVMDVFAALGLVGAFSCFVWAARQRRRRWRAIADAAGLDVERGVEVKHAYHRLSTATNVLRELFLRRVDEQRTAGLARGWVHDVEQDEDTGGMIVYRHAAELHECLHDESLDRACRKVERRLRQVETAIRARR